MPPPAGKKAGVTEEEYAILEQWIKEGAEYESHWAFVTPEKPILPPVIQKDWVHNPIDHFILSKLESKGIKPSPEADKETLARRVHMDLTGLPPSPKDIDAYLNDSTDEAYEKMVDKAIASKHYGERMTIDWLDVSRYGDTNAIHVDMMRTSWPWRDWVINAFNNNMPYSQFVIEQLAGDLLPNPTVQQKVATAFNRHHGITNEGGSIPEEVLVEYAVDRVSTMGSAFMGLTLACARCHDHKFDPISQDDFFSLMSFFNNIPETAKEEHDEYRAYAYAPYVKVYSKQQERDLALSAKVLAERNRLKALPKDQKLPPLSDEKALHWEALDPKAISMDKNNFLPPLHVVKTPKDINKSSGGKITKVKANKSIHFRADLRMNPSFYISFSTPNEVFNTIRIEHLPLQSPKKSEVFRPYQMNFNLAEFQVEHVNGKDVTKLEITDAKTSLGLKEDTIKNAFDGNQNTVWKKSVQRVNHHTLFQFKKALSLTGGEIRVRIKLKGRMNNQIHTDMIFYTANNPHGLADTLALIPSKDRQNWHKDEMMMNQYKSANKTPYSAYDLSKAILDQDYIDLMVVRCMTMKENPDISPTYVLSRGLYDHPIKDRPRPRVTPAVFKPMDDEMPKNRLGLAKWLVSDDNPLTARVTVNRFWQQIFENGIVKTSEDFGLQSESPSHSDLLDYLAVDFIETGWDVKAIMKQIVMSATYRQSSVHRKELMETDPENRLLAYATSLPFPCGNDSRQCTRCLGFI